MKTRQKDRDIPGPSAPWNEIRQHLWMGGHFWTDSDGHLQPAVARSEFDLVISLYARNGHGPDPGVEHLVAELPDSVLSADQIHMVTQLAHITATAVRDGRTILVRCQSGYNRSGLVIAQTLVALGQSAESAIDLVRRRRSPWALNNETFEQYLTTGLDIAYLLTGLEATA